MAPKTDDATPRELVDDEELAAVQCAGCWLEAASKKEQEAFEHSMSLVGVAPEVAAQHTRGKDCKHAPTAPADPSATSELAKRWQANEKD